MDEYQMEFATGFGESYQNCPACGSELVAGHSECFSCGVVLNRFQIKMETEKTHNAIGGIEHLTSFDLKKLDKKWKQVVVNYHDQNGHQSFISLCQENGALPFAVHHYSKMLEIDKEDDIAQVMRRQALSRLSFSITAEPEETINVFNRLHSLLRITSLLGMSFGLISVITGILKPAHQNLVGLGVAIIAIFAALYIFQRK